MIKNLVVLCSLMIVLSTKAQQTEEQKYALTTSVSTDGLSIVSIMDPYLSPLNYSGFGYVATDLERHFISPNNPFISTQYSSDLTVGVTLNPTATAMILYYERNYGRGFHYHLKPQNDTQILLGGVMDLELGFKQNSRNINNPFAIDLSTNLNLSGILMHDFILFKRTMQLQLKLETPLLGSMFVPLQGSSYYEMFLLGDLSNTLHFSSLHNKIGINETISLDIPFNHSVWRIGMNYHNLKYKANDMVFRRTEFSLIAGTTFDFVTFAGRKNKAPKNFISTKEIL